MASKRLQARRINEAARQDFNAAVSRYSEARDVAARQCGLDYLPEAPAELMGQRDSRWTLVTPTFFTKIDPPECVKQHRAAKAQSAAAWGTQSAHLGD